MYCATADVSTVLSSARVLLNLDFGELHETGFIFPSGLSGKIARDIGSGRYNAAGRIILRTNARQDKHR